MTDTPYLMINPIQEHELADSPYVLIITRPLGMIGFSQVTVPVWSLKYESFCVHGLNQRGDDVVIFPLTFAHLLIDSKRITMMTAEQAEAKMKDSIEPMEEREREWRDGTGKNTYL